MKSMEIYQFIPLQETDLSRVLEIYNYYVVNSTATFHTNPLTLNEMRELVFFNNPKYQTFLIIRGEETCGYVLLTRHKARAAYDHTAEVTVYLHPQFTHQGLGTLALQYIESFARTRQFHVLVATVCGQNHSSIRLFEKNGYSQCAHYHEVGRKFEQWLDLVAYQKIL